MGSRLGRVWAVAVGFLVLLLALPMTAGGIWLIRLGGSWYYALAGLGLLLSGGLLLRRRLAGGWLYLLVWLATLAWAYGEAGADGWALMPRVLAPTIVLVLVVSAMPALRGPSSRSGWWAGQLAAGIALSVLLVGAGAMIWNAAPTAPSVGEDGGAAAPTLASAQDLTGPGGNWPVYAGSNEGRHYSPLAQITVANVGRLQRVWIDRTGDMPSGSASDKYAPETTPIEIDGRLFLCSAKNIMIALDAETGQEQWRFDPQVTNEAIPYGATCRGVAHHAASDAMPGQACAQRVIEGTLDARLIAVDARTGHLCAAFGEQGTVDLNRGLGKTVPGWYAVTSPPTILRGIVVVGAQVKDGQARDAPSGVVRGYDVVTGRLAWAWDMGRPERSEAPGPGEAYTRGTPNMWTMSSADEALGLIYLPMGNPAVDYYGADRRDFDERYGSSLVALDVTTGKPVWHFQTVHHDLWDYDLGSPPALLDVTTATGVTPALLLPSKRGELYLLDRRTGQPLAPVEERKVPTGGVEPDRLSPTQPFSGYADLSTDLLTEADMWGMSSLDQLWCRIKFRRASYQGRFTSPTVDRAYIQYPSNTGGSDWGGIAVDAARGIVIANYNDMADLNQLLPRTVADAMGMRSIDQGGTGDGAEGAGGPQVGAPYAIQVNAGWQTRTGLLCKRPPYGHIRAIELATGRTLWDRPLGTAVRNGPFGIPSMLPWTIGTPSNGGPLVTAGGLVFIAATTDDAFRAIDIHTGAVVWEDRLPAGGQATPMTYESGGRQYLVIAPGGHHAMRTRIGDYVIAYALPAG